MSSAADKQLSPEDLSPDQREVYEEMKRWTRGGASNGSGLLTVGGVGGSGKSTLLGVLAANVDLKIAYVTFTGRASSVLGRKLHASGVKTTNMLLASGGANGEERPIAGYSYGSLSPQMGLPFCGTIHRLLYRPMVDSKTEEILGWTKRTALDRGYDLIVIDEASMINEELLADLRVHNTPILAVGDHGQLPPVMSKGGLMDNPMLRLEKIHRQAEGSAIIQLSKVIRETGRMPRKSPGDAVVFARKGDVGEVLANAYAEDTPLDVGVLCWTNKNRVKLNGLARAAAGFVGPPGKGEVVMCLKNMPPVYNGMRGLLTESASVGNMPWHLNAHIEFPEESLSEMSFVLNAAQFNREKTFASVEELRERGIDVQSMKMAGSAFDFGCALTVYKSQGSSFKHAIFYDDMPSSHELWAKHAYTAVTRGADRLTVMV
jgi:exodeoxyribonuclease-5